MTTRKEKKGMQPKFLRIPTLRGMRDETKEPLRRRHSLTRTNHKGTAYSLTPIEQDSRIDESSFCYFFAFPDLEGKTGAGYHILFR